MVSKRGEVKKVWRRLTDHLGGHRRANEFEQSRVVHELGQKRGRMPPSRRLGTRSVVHGERENAELDLGVRRMASKGEGRPPGTAVRVRSERRELRLKGDYERGEMSWRSHTPRLLDLLSPSEQAKDWSNSMSSSGTHELMIWSRPADCNLLREGQVPRAKRAATPGDGQEGFETAGVAQSITGTAAGRASRSTADRDHDVECRSASGKMAVALRG